MAHKIVFPLPKGELWGCVICEMLANRHTDADVIFVEGEPGKAGIVKTGLCASHAEIIEHIMPDFRQAQQAYNALLAAQE